MDIKPFSGPRYAENQGRCGSALPCVLCGKAVKDENAPMARVLDGGDRFGTAEEMADTNDAGDMGSFPVGPECVKRLRKAGVFIF